MPNVKTLPAHRKRYGRGWPVPVVCTLKSVRRGQSVGSTNTAKINTDALEALIGQHWQEIQSSGYQRIEYKNVSDWVQKKIEEKLASGLR